MLDKWGKILYNIDRMRKINTAAVDRYFDEWVDKYGVGPCGSIAALARKRGLGEIALIMVAPEATGIGGDGFPTPHCVNANSDGTFTDHSGFLPAGRLMPAAKFFTVEWPSFEGDMPDLTDTETIAWWDARI